MEQWKADEPTAAWLADAGRVHGVIYKLRKKLDQAGFPDLLQSMGKGQRGGGYRLATPALNQIITLRKPIRSRAVLQLGPTAPK